MYTNDCVCIRVLNDVAEEADAEEEGKVAPY